jgi:hypothetical protein
MEYKKGYKIKPYSIDKNGVVRFTDGTEITLLANEKTCKAYGYKYDADRGVCRAFDVKVNVRNIGKPKDKSSSKNSLIVGRDNKLSQNENTFVTGSDNKVSNRIKNSSIIGGSYGKATHAGEVVIGGGGFNSEAGLLQYSIIQLSAKTTGANDTILYIDYDEDATNQITLPANSVTTYEIFLSALCTGGDDGTAGDYEAYFFQGVVRTTNNGTITHNAKIDRLLGRTGSLGTEVIDTSTAYTLSIIVGGLANVDTQYHAVVKLHINKTNVVEI